MQGSSHKVKGGLKIELRLPGLIISEHTPHASNFEQRPFSMH